MLHFTQIQFIFIDLKINITLVTVIDFDTSYNFIVKNILRLDSKKLCYQVSNIYHYDMTMPETIIVKHKIK
jgi:hypothetical protein